MLKEYARKRHFDVTPEPRPETPPAALNGRPLTFVVQKHAATRLHYDFRIELDGVLVSWAVPKGPSLDPSKRHLAVHVEDHPFDYGGFEGIIPQDQYGGGEVIIWDRGTYYTEKAPLDRESQEQELRIQMERGKVEIVLQGEKLKGRFNLIHTKDKQWLMMKGQDQFATTRDILLDDRSVLTEHRIGGVTTGKKLPDLKPMLMTEAQKPFSNKDWTFELKLDGVRVLTYLEEAGIRMLTRNGIDSAPKLPHVVAELQPYMNRGAIVDAEVVVFSEEGVPSFHLLMDGFQAGRARSAVLCMFDLLFLDGEDLRRKPWKERRKILEEFAPQGPHLRLLDTFPEDGELLYDHAKELGFEGIVAKRIDSRYEDGVRSKGWVKLKSYHSEEFVVGGFAPGNGARASTFGALLVGERTDHGLEYVANVGGGFNDAQLDELKPQLEAIRQKESPFATKPAIKGAVWVSPEMVAEVKFQNKTKDGKLRFPVFLRMRPDLIAPEPSEAEQAGSKDSTDPSSILAALSGSEKEMHVSVEGHEIHLTNMDKELWPGITKRDLITYYASASETLLLYLKDRPISLVRCPGGIDGQRFFQKHAEKGKPGYVETVRIHSDSNEGARDYILCNNLATLIWCGQIAALELNPWNSRIVADPGAPISATDFSSSHDALEDSVLNRPDYLVLDLDPHFGGKATGWKQAEWEMMVEVALDLRDVLKSIGLNCYPKSSGKSGFHLYVPVSRDYTYEQIRAAGYVIGGQVAQHLGKKVTLEFNVRKRPDGVFIDINQNVRGKTMAAPYSPRAAHGAGVSMPLLWNELHRVDPTQFTVLTAAERLRTKGDLWRGMLGEKQRLIV